MANSNTRCPTPLSLSVALAQGEQSPLYQHIRSCPSCAADASLASLGRELPRYAPSSAQKEQALSALLAAAATKKPQPSRSRVGWLLSVAVAAGIALLGVALWPRGEEKIEPKGLYTLIASSPDARYTSEAEERRDSIVLSGGSLQLDATKLPSERELKVSTKDATIETHYSSFTVAAYGEMLLRIEVTVGQVTLKLSSQGQVQLGAGERWEKSPTTASTKPTTQIVAPLPKTMAVAPPMLVPATKPMASSMPKAIDPAEIAYQEGVEALKANDFQTAAQRFSFTVSSTKESSLAEDASFWYTVALLRAGKDGEALTALKAFLVSYPNSSRAGESRVALGWLLLERKELNAAEQSFTSALEDRSSAVRASAQKGLEAVAAKRQAP